MGKYIIDTCKNSANEFVFLTTKIVFIVPKIVFVEMYEKLAGDLNALKLISMNMYIFHIEQIIIV